MPTQNRRSAWDSCVFGCSIPLSQSKLCGGPGLGDWSFLTEGETITDAPTQAPADSSYDYLVTVTVYGNDFLLNGVAGDFEVERGKTYMFDATDSSVVSGYHQFRVRQTGKYASPGGVKRVGDQTTGEQVLWTVGGGVTAGKCEFICRNHAGMGALFTVAAEEEETPGGEANESTEVEEDDPLLPFDTKTLIVMGGAGAVALFVAGVLAYKLTSWRRDTSRLMKSTDKHKINFKINNGLL